MKAYLVGAFSGVLGTASALSAQTGKPNIIYIFTDQQTATAMSCAGNTDLRTPAMDKLAKEGIRFINSYCTAPLSSPSRSSMFTGYYPHQTGILKNGMPIPENLTNESLGHLMTKAGYSCFYAGKWHLPGNTIDDAHGFKKIHNFGDSGIDEKCSEFLKQNKQNPFFLVISIDNPHNICEYARGQPLPWAVINESDNLSLPNLPGNFNPSPYEPEVIRIEQKMNFNLYPVINYSDDDWRRYRNAYFRLVEEADRLIGNILQTIFSAGLDKNTVIILSSDHGDGSGAHKWNQKSALFEEVINIPLIVRLPGGKNGNNTLPHLVNNGPDLFASICDWAGIVPPNGIMGKSFRALADGSSSAPIHSYLVTETLFDRSEMRGWAVRTENFKYVMYPAGQYREQLFDMAIDRHETVNHAVESKYQKVLIEHRNMLKDWAVETNYKEVQRYIPR